MPSPAEVTQLLARWRAGDADARDALFPIVYDELRRLAAWHLGKERSGHTLQPTALVHEAYLRLAGQSGAEWQNRAHFMAIASQMMRRILVDHARARAAEKRGGGATFVTLDDSIAADDSASLELIALDAALERLAAMDGRQSQIVELRYFGGLSIEETAEATGLSPATVKREWTMARAWLRRELAG